MMKRNYSDKTVYKHINKTLASNYIEIYEARIKQIQRLIKMAFVHLVLTRNMLSLKMM